MKARRIQTRRYQVKASKFAMTAPSKSVLIVAPGASGKTVIAALITKAARRAKKKVLLVSHRAEIVNQTKNILAMNNEKATTIMGSETSEEQGPVIVASINTLASRQLYPEVEVVVIDEAHRAAADSYAKLIQHYRKKGARIIGLSATPYRLDGRGLNMFFNEMYEAAKPSQLLGRYIMKPRTFSAAAEYLPDLIDLDSLGGDFKINDLVKRVNKDGLIGGIVKTLKKHWRAGSLGVVFAVSIEHSKNIAERLCKAGFKARHIDGSFKPEDRTQLLDDLKSRKIEIVTCCMLLSEGWDLPDCDFVVMARPTRSLSLCIQMANRGARISRNRPIILDHACNTLMHNFSWIDRNWSLDGKERGDPRRLHPLRVCKACGCINSQDAEKCEDCGSPLKPVQRALSPKERAELELVEWTQQERNRRLKKLKQYVKTNKLSDAWMKGAMRLWGL